MKIAFHGSNAATFRAEIEPYLPAAHEISVLSDELSDAGETRVFMGAQVIIGTGMSTPRIKTIPLVPATCRFTNWTMLSSLPKCPAGPGEPSGDASRY
jgi:hypothetical protein